MNFMDGSKAKMSQYSKDQSHVQNKDYFKNKFMTWDNTLRWGHPQCGSLPSWGPDFGSDPQPSHQRVLSFIKVTILPSHLQSKKESNQRFELWSHHQSFFTSSAILFGGEERTLHLCACLGASFFFLDALLSIESHCQSSTSSAFYLGRRYSLQRVTPYYLPIKSSPKLRNARAYRVPQKSQSWDVRAIGRKMYLCLFFFLLLRGYAHICSCQILQSSGKSFDSTLPDQMGWLM
jgi:hypothetical protein